MHALEDARELERIVVSQAASDRIYLHMRLGKKLGGVVHLHTHQEVVTRLVVEAFEQVTEVA